MALRLFFSKMTTVVEAGFSFRASTPAAFLRSAGGATFSTVEIGAQWALTCADVSDAVAAALAALPEVREVPLLRDGRGWIDWASAKLGNLTPPQKTALLTFLQVEFGFDSSGLSSEALLSEIINLIGLRFHSHFDIEHLRAFGVTTPPEKNP